MDRYLVDTDVLIDYSWIREPSYTLLLAMLASKDEVGICAIQLTEIYAGQARGERRDLDLFLDSFPCWEITPATGVQAGDYRRTFARLGRTINTPDAINAAVASRMRAAIVTRNAKGYPMPDVAVVVP